MFLAGEPTEKSICLSSSLHGYNCLMPQASTIYALNGSPALWALHNLLC
jgi:hypothetical protein